MGREMAQESGEGSGLSGEGTRLTDGGTRLTDEEPRLTGGTVLADGAVRFSEQDLALVEALQAAPRAPWSRIGRALGVDATTAARRWERLRAAGLAWVTAYDTVRTATVGFVEVSCRPQDQAEVIEAACAMPWVFDVNQTSGDFDLLLSVAAEDLPALGRAVHRHIGELPGVRGLRVGVGISLFGEGSDWRMRAMPPAGRAELGPPRPQNKIAYSTQPFLRPTPQDQAVLDALGVDGRLGYTGLAELTGLSEYAVRRRLQRMLNEGRMQLRCDMAYPLAGLSVHVVYRMRVPHHAVDVAGRTVARLEQVRMAASVSGPDNLLVHAVLHGMGDIGRFETLLAERLPELEIRNRVMTFRTLKRVGWLLDAQGRAVGRVPLGPPPP
ncbi:Lrp/AsnC family transcriptional regulator [Streptomyces sp. NPDC021093]|uniref:Lrp/AsnC family transcriptional regulator n=1 Tax=Streptomyces sp. NPDC021093 TaxID=3365112 RepID=UPI00379D5A8A